MKPRTLMARASFISLCIQVTGVKRVRKLHCLKPENVWKHKGISSRVWVPSEQCLGTETPSHPGAPPALIRMVAVARRQPTPAKQRCLFGTEGDFDYVLLWRRTEDIYDRSFPIKLWPEGMKKTTLKPLYTAAQWERVSVFSQRKIPAFSSTLKQEGRRLFYLYTSLFLEQVKGQFCPHCTLGQYWELRVSLDHTLFVLMTAVLWIILQSDVLAPCPVPPLSVINWCLAYSSFLC